jgi:hypothetical protein
VERGLGLSSVLLVAGLVVGSVVPAERASGGLVGPADVVGPVEAEVWGAAAGVGVVARVAGKVGEDGGGWGRGVGERGLEVVGEVPWCGVGAVALGEGCQGRVLPVAAGLVRRDKPAWERR